MRFTKVNNSGRFMSPVQHEKTMFYSKLNNLANESGLLQANNSLQSVYYRFNSGREVTDSDMLMYNRRLIVIETFLVVFVLFLWFLSIFFCIKRYSILLYQINKPKLKYIDNKRPYYKETDKSLNSFAFQPNYHELDDRLLIRNIQRPFNYSHTSMGNSIYSNTNNQCTTYSSKCSIEPRTVVVKTRNSSSTKTHVAKRLILRGESKYHQNLLSLDETLLKTKPDDDYDTCNKFNNVYSISDAGDTVNNRQRSTTVSLKGNSLTTITCIAETRSESTTSKRKTKSKSPVKRQSSVEELSDEYLTFTIDERLDQSLIPTKSTHKPVPYAHTLAIMNSKWIPDSIKEKLESHKKVNKTNQPDDLPMIQQPAKKPLSLQSSVECQGSKLAKNLNKQLSLKTF